MGITSYFSRKMNLKGVTVKEKLSLLTYLFVLIGLAVLKYLLELHIFDFLPKRVLEYFGPNMVQAAMTGCMILALSKGVKVFFINKISDKAVRLNLTRVFNLFVGIIVFFFLLTVLFANWYTFVVSLGLISLVLGFALQTPITSFIGWIYIIIFRPYKVGDWVKIGDVTGDVTDLGYLDTTISESYGEHLDSEHYSGRIVRIPNANILTTAVFNYTGNRMPLIWDEAKVYVDFSSDLELLEKIMTEVVSGQTQNIPEQKNYKTENPYVSVRNSENTYLEVRVHYQVLPAVSGHVKTQVLKELLKKIQAARESIYLPASDNR